MGISTRVAITGEREYRESLNNINSGLKVLKAEMTATSAKFKDNSSSVEALTAKNDVLDRTLSSQREKVQLLREQLKKSADAYGEGSQNTMRLQEALYKAEAAVSETESALRANEEALKDNATASGDAAGATDELVEAENEVAESSKGLGDVISGLADKLGIKLPDGAKNALNGLGQIPPGAAAAAAGFAAVAAAVVKAEQAMINLTKEAAANADEIITLSMQTGISTQTIQEFEYASQLLDVSLDTVQGSLTKLTSVMGKAQDGSESARAAFEALGVQYEDSSTGELRSAEDVFYDVIDALGQVENSTERDTLAMDFFGKSAQDLNPFIIAGTNSLKELAQQANDTGYVLDDFALEKLGAVDDALVQVEQSRKIFTQNMAVQFAPYLEKALTRTNEFWRQLANTVKDTAIGESLGRILDTASNLITPLGTLAKTTLPVLKVALDGVSVAAGILVDLLNVIMGAVTFDWGTLKSGLTLSNTRANASAAIGKNAGGTDNWRGGWTLVGEAGPELVNLPRGSAVYSNQESERMGNTVFNITIDAKNVREFNDIIRFANQQKTLARMGAV